ncbi:MAG: zinc ribbon domain-containing protein [Desulfuromonadales bacterium]|nr:zinc ribbon domain-containing protein [Desulfuromonadales bacterium]
MMCPKCGFKQPDVQEQCQRCGVIFAKVHGVPEQQSEPALVGQKHARFGELLKKVLTNIPREKNPVVQSGRMLVWLGLVVWGVKFMFTPVSGEAFSESYMHLVNLPFHEAGHILFSPFGPFVQVLGGTLGQLLIPLIVTVSFAIKGNLFAVSVGFWWLGQSFMDCAPYIDDARAGQLMLLGGVTGSEVEDYHDWENILSRLGMMQYDHLVARIFFGRGVLIVMTALVWGGYVLCRQRLKYCAT